MAKHLRSRRPVPALFCVVAVDAVPRRCWRRGAQRLLTAGTDAVGQLAPEALRSPDLLLHVLEQSFEVGVVVVAARRPVVRIGLAVVAAVVRLEVELAPRLPFRLRPRLATCLEYLRNGALNIRQTQVRNRLAK